MKGKLIVFEGIDGVGKTTLSLILKNRLKKSGIKVIRYEDIEKKNQGFNLIKNFVKKEADINSSLFFYIASAIYKSQIIGKILEKNRWVLCDRYVFSTLAYHKIRGAKTGCFKNVNSLPIIFPDFTFLIKTKEKVRMGRILKRITNTKYDLKKKSDDKMIAKMEKELEKFKPLILDNSYESPEETAEKILGIIR